MIELYETKFGVCDHINSINPLSSVQYNKSEEYMKNFIYDGYLSTFIHRDIGRKLNMSFDDFISRPRYEIDAIIRIVQQIDEKKASINENLMKNLQSSVPKDDIDDII